MSCQCAMQPLCPECGRAVHRCRELAVNLRGREYHLRCWETTTDQLGEEEDDAS